jgi:hypothetical protein
MRSHHGNFRAFPPHSGGAVGRPAVTAPRPPPGRDSRLPLRARPALAYCTVSPVGAAGGKRSSRALTPSDAAGDVGLTARE